MYPRQALRLQVPTNTVPPSSSPKPIVFYVMGDMPYSRQETLALRGQVSNIPNDATFVVHVGDINKVATMKCAPTTYASVRSVLLRSAAPVFVLPGNTDIYDCPVQTIARKHWMTNLHALENNWNLPMTVDRASGRIPDFSFFMHGVLFMGVDIIGGAFTSQVQRPAAVFGKKNDWMLGRMNAYRQIMKGVVIFGHSKPQSLYSTFFLSMAKVVKEFGVPTLFIHGDGHVWQHEKQAFGVPNLLRVQVDRGGIAPPVRVEFSAAAAAEPFVFDRRM